MSARRARGSPLSRRFIAALLAALLGASLVATTHPVGAVQPGPHSGRLVTATSPASWTPHVLDGYVETFAEVGETMVVGGNFTKIATAAAPTAEILRNHIFSFQKGTGTINSSFSPQVNGQITSVVPSGDGQTVFIAGGFSQAQRPDRPLARQGEPRHRPARDPVQPARVQRPHRRPAAAQRQAVHLRPLHHRRRRRPDPARSRRPGHRGTRPERKATFADPRNGGTLSILSSDVTPDGSTMIAIGNFTRSTGSTATRSSSST